MKAQILKFLLSESGFALWVALQNPNEWTILPYEDRHKSGVHFWNANGGFFYDYDQGTLGIIERHFLWSARNKMARSKIAMQLSGKANP